MFTSNPLFLDKGIYREELLLQIFQKENRPLTSPKLSMVENLHRETLTVEVSLQTTRRTSLIIQWMAPRTRT